MMRIFQKVTDAFKRTAPGELASLNLSARKRRCIMESAREALEKQGIDPASFDWLLPATELRIPGALGNDVIADDGVVAARGSILYAFGYVADELRIEQGVLEAAAWGFTGDLLQPSLSIELPLARFRQARVFLDSSCDYSAGPWWQALQHHSRGLIIPEGATLGLAHLTLSEVQRDAFGVRPTGERRVAVCWVHEGLVNVWPDGWSFSVAHVVGWNSEGETSVTFCISDSQRIALVEIQQLTCGAEPALIRALMSSLAALGPQEPRLRSVLEHSGLFLGRKPSHSADDLVWLCTQDGKVKQDPLGKDHHQPFSLGYVKDDHAVICHLDGDALALRSGSAVLSKIYETLPHFSELRGSAEGPWGVFLTDGQAGVRTPVLARVMEGGLRVGSTPDIPWGELIIEDSDDDRTDGEIVRLRRRDEEWQCDLAAPRSLVTSLRGEVEARQVASIIATEKPGALYERLATLRRDSFLFLLLGDVALLLAELDRSGDLSQVAQILATAQPEKLTSDQREAVESALRQLTLLAAALPQIKQRLELVSLETPYAWAQQEQGWIEGLFGPERARTAGEKESARGRELLSRSVRSLTAPMQRSLAELESAMRPVESLLSREDIQRHWSMKVRRWGPTLVTAVLGGASAAAVIASGGSLLVIAPTIGIALNQIMAGETEKLLRDREKVLTLRRAVGLAASWIDLLRRGAEVSAIEAKRFIERENLRAARRDRLLFEQCPPPLKASVLINLRDEVQRRSTAAKRAAFLELAPGSTKCLGSVTAYVALLANDVSANAKAETVSHKQIQS